MENASAARAGHGIPDEADFGRRVREARQSLRMSQQALGARMGELGHPWHQTTVSKVEQARQGVSLDQAYCLAAILGQPLREFLDDKPPTFQRAYDSAAGAYRENFVISAFLASRLRAIEEEVRRLTGADIVADVFIESSKAEQDLVAAFKHYVERGAL